jgi:uncharacterized RDD family membrane protein YckC
MMDAAASAPQSGYDPLGSRLITGEAVALDLLPTPWVLRGAGVIIDYVIYFALYLGLGYLLTIVTIALEVEAAVAAALSVALLVVCLVVTPTAIETIWRGRSVGKLAVGARVVRDDGGAIGFRHAFIRALVALPEVVFTVGGIAAIVGFLNERSKRVGDYLAGTYSQRERVSRKPRPTFGVPVELEQWATTADVARMPERLARRIGQFLAQAPGLTPASRGRLAHELAAEASVFVSPLPESAAEPFLAAVSAIRRDRELTALRLEQARMLHLEPALTGLPQGFPDRG